MWLVLVGSELGFRVPCWARELFGRSGAIKARFTRAVRRVGFHPALRSKSEVRKGKARAWQRRFWEHHIRGEADDVARVRYCWSNPVKHGFVERPEDWAFSPVHRDGRTP